MNTLKSQSNRLRILEEKITKTQIEHQKNRFRNKETSFFEKEEINNLQMVQQQFYTSLQQTNVFADIISKQIGGILRKRASSPERVEFIAKFLRHIVSMYISQKFFQVIFLLFCLHI